MKKVVTVVFVLLLIVVVVSMIMGGGLTQPEKAIRILSQQGYTNIEITGWRPMMCSDEDDFATGFQATSSNGSVVTGCVCSGIMKGSTIRLD